MKLNLICPSVNSVNRADAANLATSLNLCQAEIGSKLRVRDLPAQPAVCSRLRELGMCEFAEIHKLADNGALICLVCGARVALSRSLGEQIIVEKIIGS